MINTLKDLIVHVVDLALEYQQAVRPWTPNAIYLYVHELVNRGCTNERVKTSILDGDRDCLILGEINELHRLSLDTCSNMGLAQAVWRRAEKETDPIRRQLLELAGNCLEDTYVQYEKDAKVSDVLNHEVSETLESFTEEARKAIDEVGYEDEWEMHECESCPNAPNCAFK